VRRVALVQRMFDHATRDDADGQLDDSFGIIGAYADRDYAAGWLRLEGHRVLGKS